jgi:hypothetical protein
MWLILPLLVLIAAPAKADITHNSYKSTVQPAKRRALAARIL